MRAKTVSLRRPVSAQTPEWLEQSKSSAFLSKEDNMARDFMMYWAPETADAGTAEGWLLNHAASNQLRRIFLVYALT